MTRMMLLSALRAGDGKPTAEEMLDTSVDGGTAAMPRANRLACALAMAAARAALLADTFSAAAAPARSLSRPMMDCTASSSRVVEPAQTAYARLRTCNDASDAFNATVMALDTCTCKRVVRAAKVAAETAPPLTAEASEATSCAAAAAPSGPLFPRADVSATCTAELTCALLCAAPAAAESAEVLCDSAHTTAALTCSPVDRSTFVAVSRRDVWRLLWRRGVAGGTRCSTSMRSHTITNKPTWTSVIWSDTAPSCACTYDEKDMRTMATNTTRTSVTPKAAS